MKKETVMDNLNGSMDSIILVNGHKETGMGKEYGLTNMAIVIMDSGLWEKEKDMEFI